jgi:hypothetical protein
MTTFELVFEAAEIVLYFRPSALCTTLVSWSPDFLGIFLVQQKNLIV